VRSLCSEVHCGIFLSDKVRRIVPVDFCVRSEQYAWHNFSIKPEEIG